MSDVGDRTHRYVRPGSLNFVSQSRHRVPSAGTPPFPTFATKGTGTDGAASFAVWLMDANESYPLLEENNRKTNRLLCARFQSAEVR